MHTNEHLALLEKLVLAYAEKTSLNVTFAYSKNGIQIDATTNVGIKITDQKQFDQYREMLNNRIPESYKLQYQRHCTAYGLTPDDFGTAFLDRGEVILICGIRPRNFKYPILGYHIKDNNIYKYRKTTVLDALGRK